MRAVSWMIVTPSASVAWDGSRLRNTGPPASAGLPLPPAQVPDDPGHCRRCGLWEHATQAVPGVGPARARIMLVGEQPGDQEDLEGLPFVGPAGKLLERALAEAGLERRKLYLTNAVKHFKWELRGKRRIHKTPAQREVQACLHWLEAELARVAPRVVVALGAVALKALTGDPGATLQGAQGRPRRHGERWLVATYHPAYVLRMPDPEQRQRAFAALVESLREARRLQDT
ncbi:MAG: UdgX family uracil-DNA binding protein [Pseudomonadota bacterium]